jgi:hypothetical protein
MPKRQLGTIAGFVAFFIQVRNHSPLQLFLSHQSLRPVHETQNNPRRPSYTSGLKVDIALTGKNSGRRGLAAYFMLLRRKRSGSMENVKSIENAVESLPPTELAEFRKWFAEFDGAAWDRQIEQDAASGKLDQLAAEALADYRAGSPRQL